MTAEEFKEKFGNFVVGQFVFLDDDTENTWEGAYVREVFDDRVIVASRLQQYAHIWGSVGREDCKIDVPTRNDKPVMAKKNLFGRYTFKAKC